MRRRNVRFAWGRIDEILEAVAVDVEDVAPRVRLFTVVFRSSVTTDRRDVLECRRRKSRDTIAIEKRGRRGLSVIACERVIVVIVQGHRTEEGLSPEPRRADVEVIVEAVPTDDSTCD